MPRRARLRIAAVPLHLIQRGNNRSACFFDQVDYTFYLDHLRELTLKFSCAVHAYVLMTNHVHLLMTAAKDDGPSLLMKHLACIIHESGDPTRFRTHIARLARGTTR